ncbi:MAG: hypothetical protein ACR2HP_11615 [Ilumatobacteraceae bacterium]
MAISRPAKRLANPYLTKESPEDLSPPNRIAFEIFAERRDLLPSVERIMNAGLDEQATTKALDLFRTSLGTPGDPHRDPAVAIATIADGTLKDA